MAIENTDTGHTVKKFVLIVDDPTHTITEGDVERLSLGAFEGLIFAARRCGWNLQDANVKQSTFDVNSSDEFS